MAFFARDKMCTINDDNAIERLRKDFYAEQLEYGFCIKVKRNFSIKSTKLVINTLIFSKNVYFRKDRLIIN